MPNSNVVSNALSKILHHEVIDGAMMKSHDPERLRLAIFGLLLPDCRYLQLKGTKLTYLACLQCHEGWLAASNLGLRPFSPQLRQQISQLATNDQVREFIGDHFQNLAKCLIMQLRTDRTVWSEVEFILSHRLDKNSLKK